MGRPLCAGVEIFFPGIAGPFLAEGQRGEAGIVQVQTLSAVVLSGAEEGHIVTAAPENQPLECHIPHTGIKPGEGADHGDLGNEGFFSFSRDVEKFPGVPVKVIFPRFGEGFPHVGEVVFRVRFPGDIPDAGVGDDLPFCRVKGFDLEIFPDPQVGHGDPDILRIVPGGVEIPFFIMEVVIIVCAGGKAGAFIGHTQKIGFRITGRLCRFAIHVEEGQVFDLRRQHGAERGNAVDFAFCPAGDFHSAGKNGFFALRRLDRHGKFFGKMERLSQPVCTFVDNDLCRQFQIPAGEQIFHPVVCLLNIGVDRIPFPLAIINVNDHVFSPDCVVYGGFCGKNIQHRSMVYNIFSAKKRDVTLQKRDVFPFSDPATAKSDTVLGRYKGE